MQPVFDRLPAPALRRLQLRMRRVLRPIGGHRQARQSPRGSDAGGHSPVQGQPASSRDSWFAERVHLGTPLSDAELQHGVNAGLISSTLLIAGSR